MRKRVMNVSDKRFNVRINGWGKLMSTGGGEGAGIG